jgi:hypothetical protein
MREIFLRGNSFYAPLRVEASSDGANGNSNGSEAEVEVDSKRWEKLLESKRSIENYFHNCVVLV